MFGFSSDTGTNAVEILKQDHDEVEIQPDPHAHRTDQDTFAHTTHPTAIIISTATAVPSQAGASSFLIVIEVVKRAVPILIIRGEGACSSWVREPRQRSHPRIMERLAFVDS